MVERRRLALVAIVVLLLAAGFLTQQSMDRRWPFSLPEGPLGTVAEHGYQVNVEVGESFTDSMETLRLPGSDVGRVITVTPVYETDGLKTVGVWAAGRDRSATAAINQVYDEAPPRDPDLGTITKVSGRTFSSIDRAPGQLQLLLATKATRKGVFLRTGYEVEYEYGGNRYKDFVNAQIRVCADVTCPEGWSGE